MKIINLFDLLSNLNTLTHTPRAYFSSDYKTDTETKIYFYLKNEELTFASGDVIQLENGQVLKILDSFHHKINIRNPSVTSPYSWYLVSALNSAYIDDKYTTTKNYVTLYLKNPKNG